MAGINDYSNTPSLNTTINTIDVDEGCNPANINDAIRQLMADIADVDDGVVPLQTPDINGGTIDGASLGASSPITSATISGDLTVDTDTFIVDSTNNRVGIGTASPSYDLQISKDGGGASVRLDVVNTGVAANDDTLLSFLSGSNNNENIIYFGDTDDNNVGIIRYNHATDYMSFTTNALERMRIDSSGNVGIGTTSPIAELDIHADVPSIQLTDTDGTNQIGLIYENAGNLFLQSQNDTANGKITLRRYDGSTLDSTITMDSGGGLLLGTTSAGSAVKGDIVVDGNIYLGGTGSANALDDYEEGTWTPTLGVGSWGTVYYATYTKIGKIVYINMRASGPSNTTNTGSFTIEGLPFTQAGGGEYATGSVMVNYITTATNDVDITAFSYPGNNIVRLFAQDRVGGNWDAVEYSFLDASTNIYLSLWYNTDT